MINYYILEDESEEVTCDFCDARAEYETDEHNLCEEHHEQHVDGYRSEDA